MVPGWRTVCTGGYQDSGNQIDKRPEFKTPAFFARAEKAAGHLTASCRAALWATCVLPLGEQGNDKDVGSFRSVCLCTIGPDNSLNTKGQSSKTPASFARASPTPLGRIATGEVASFIFLLKPQAHHLWPYSQNCLWEIK